MEVIVLDHFNKFKPSIIPMKKKHYYFSDKIGQAASTTAKNIFIIINFILSKGFIASFLTTIWYQKYGFTNQYNCESTIYMQ